MERDRLATLLDRCSRLRAVVIGDIFLDRYLEIDESLCERSLETGLAAHQVTAVQAAPGAAGTITANLRALGMTVQLVGVVGDDGDGYELRQGLTRLGASLDGLITVPERRTPTYIKPIVRGGAGDVPRELERLDVRSRTPLPAGISEQLIARLKRMMMSADVIYVADQVPEPGAGVITEAVREALTRLAARSPRLPVLVDSRANIHLFRGLILKPNLAEASATFAPEAIGDDPLERARHAALEVARHSGRVAFVTLGGDGMMVASDGAARHVPAPPVYQPIDIVGAGDSAMAAIGAALASGAHPLEAAQLGNLAAAVTIRKLGTTGTASAAEILARWDAA
ncbi:MAG: hypothetical protein KGS47_12070 [Chloroflexi bacterium]|nr:hypothetical protein [Chloroflexota bacterium]